MNTEKQENIEPKDKTTPETKTKKLTAKEDMFVKEYLIDLNATQAAIRAGYSEKTAKEIGYENLTKPHIQESLSSLIAERSEKIEITAEYVLNSLKELAERCLQRVPVMVRKGRGWEQAKETVEHEDGTTTEEGVWRFDSRGANSALRSLGEHLGLFKTVFSNDPKNPLPSNIQIIQLPQNGREKPEDN